MRTAQQAPHEAQSFLGPSRALGEQLDAVLAHAKAVGLSEDAVV